MSEQQWRVVADRDKGDDIRKRFMRGDRVTFGSDADGSTVPVRIERLEPTADEPMDVFQAEALRARGGHPSPHPPTREQIAAAVCSVLDPGAYPVDQDYAVAERVLALIQNGADRG